jgi:hypothetical protein
MGWKDRVLKPGSGEIVCARPVHLRGTNIPCVVGYRGSSLMAYRPGRDIYCLPTSVVEVQARAVLLS